MRTRDLLRFVPGLSRLVRSLDSRERESRLLTEECLRLADENHRLKKASGALLARLTFTDEEPPLPPGVLRLLVAGTEDAGWFLEAGQRAATSLTWLLGKHGLLLERCERVLDFGCGCGRVIRHLRHLSAELHGCDSNPVAVEWCTQHLPFARFRVNALGSPLSYDSESFDLAYALSVFTHLPQRWQSFWMSELRRILKPGGTLFISLHGDALWGHLGHSERADYRAGRLVVRGGDLIGTNYCAAFHPPAFVEHVLADGFEVLECAREGATGNPPQDAWVLRKKG
jgi:SAM-dependent methyltransferase